MEKRLGSVPHKWPTSLNRTTDPPRVFIEEERDEESFSGGSGTLASQTESKRSSLSNAAICRLSLPCLLLSFAKMVTRQRIM